MPLSDQERRVLQELERELFIQDPMLARQLETGVPSRRPKAPKVLNIIAITLGFTMLLLAIPIHPSPLGFIGFVLLATGITAHFMEKHKERKRRRI